MKGKKKKVLGSVSVIFLHMNLWSLLKVRFYLWERLTPVLSGDHCSSVTLSVIKGNNKEHFGNSNTSNISKDYINREYGLLTCA